MVFSMGNVTPIESKTVKPIVITDNETGREYTLEFNRAVIERAEKSGFVFSSEKLAEQPMSTISNLWYWSFQMHNWNMSRDKCMALLDNVSLNESIIERLALLYAEPFNALVVDEGEGESKNERVTIQL